MLIELLVIDKHVRIFDTITLQTNGQVAIAVEGVHHVSHSGTILSLAINHDAEQFATAFVCVVIEHAHGNEIVGG